MQDSQKIAVGKVRDAHGLKGELFIVLFAKRADWMNELRQFDLVRKEMVEGKLTEVRHTFTINRIKPHKLGLIVKPDEVADRTAAEGFRGAIFEISAELLTSKEGETIFLREIEGFTVYDGNQEVGPIVGFASNGPQDLLQINSRHGEALVPLIPEFVTKLDFKNKTLVMSLPPGLVPEAE